MSELQEMNNKIHERLKKKNELLMADNNLLQAKWEGQGMMIQKLHKEIKNLNQEIGGYSGTIDALIEEFNFLTGRMQKLKNEMLQR